MHRRTWTWGLLALTLAAAGVLGGWQAYARSTTGGVCCPPGCCEGKAATDCCPPDCCPPGCCDEAGAKAGASEAKTAADGPRPTVCCDGATAPKTGQARSGGCCTR